MKKVLVGLLVSSAVVAVGVGSFFVYKNINSGKVNKPENASSAVAEQSDGNSETSEKDSKNAIEIEVSHRDNFRDGVAWVKDKNGNYYLIDGTGKAIFGLDSQKGDRIYSVDSYMYGYGKVHYKNDETNTEYIKIFDKQGSMVYAEWNENQAKHEILAGPDDDGFILVNNLGKVESINLKTDYSYIDNTSWNSDTRQFESLGGGIFYNKYVGFYNASSSAPMPLDYLDIYDYDARTNFSMVKESTYTWSRFIDGKAIFVSSGHNYLVTNEGEVTEIEALKGYKLTIDNSMAKGVENSFNGKTVYGENSKTKDKGYFDMDGNKVLDLSRYNVGDAYQMYNDKAVILLKTNTLNERLLAVIDKDGNELFTPKDYNNSYYELGEKIICGDYQILDYKGNILRDVSEYEWASAFEYGGEDTITVCPTKIEQESNRMYLNSSLQEIKPWYDKNMELK